MKKTNQTKKTKNIKDFKATDLGGNSIEVKDVNKLIGNSLYFGASDLAVCEAAKSLYNEQDFEVTPELVENVRKIKQVAPWLIDQLIKFLESE